MAYAASFFLFGELNVDSFLYVQISHSELLEYGEDYGYGIESFRNSASRHLQQCNDLPAKNFSIPLVAADRDASIEGASINLEIINIELTHTEAASLLC